MSTLVNVYVEFDTRFCCDEKKRYYLPTPPLGQDMTQGQFLSGV